MNDFNNLNREKLMGALKNSNSGVNTDKLSAALQSGKLDKVLGSLNKSQSDKLQSILADEAELKRILNSPQAAALLKKFK